MVMTEGIKENISLFQLLVLERGYAIVHPMSYKKGNNNCAKK